MKLKKLALLATAAFGFSLAYAAHAAPPCSSVCDGYDSCMAAAQDENAEAACMSNLMRWSRWCTGDKSCVWERMI